MNVYKMSVIVLDFDGIGADSAKQEIEDARYGNHCIRPDVISVDARDIGEWNDDHPLNQIDSFADEIQRLFGSDDAQALRTIREATDGACDGCDLRQAVAVIISQRDNARNAAEVYRAKLKELGHEYV